MLLSLRSGLVLGLLSLLTHVAACSDDTDEQSGECGPQGVLVELSDQSVCAYKQAIVIETGFACPAAYPTRQDNAGFSICSKGQRGLSLEEVETIRDVLTKRDRWTFNDPAIEPNRNAKVDVLMVLDNSFSMCQEQQELRDNLSALLEPMLETDFHIGITTTHAPESGTSVEPIAVESRLQSTPQPVPGNNQSCLRGEEDGSRFAPIRANLDVARACLANRELASDYTWSDAQIECALDSPLKQDQNGCVSAQGLPDRNEDSRYDLFDLFPESSLYRELPKVFRRADYELDGRVDTTRLLADLRCAVTVGTRGDGYEKGLRVAVNALSPELLGGAVGSAGARSSAPNHGLIRRDARFSLFVMSDENDCSHNGTMQEIGNICGADICEYMNSTAVSDGDSVLISPEIFAIELRENLQLAKGIIVSEQDIFIAGIHGPSKRYSEPFPDCTANPSPISEACNSTAFGSAFSGDRYARFAQAFTRHYPSDESVGAICGSSLEGTLRDIGVEIAK